MSPINLLEILAAERQSSLNQRVDVYVQGGRLTFEGDRVPPGLLLHPENFHVRERVLSKKSFKVEYSFVRKSPVPTDTLPNISG